MLLDLNGVDNWPSSAVIYYANIKRVVVFLSLLAFVSLCRKKFMEIIASIWTIFN